MPRRCRHLPLCAGFNIDLYCEPLVCAMWMCTDAELDRLLIIFSFGISRIKTFVLRHSSSFPPFLEEYFEDAARLAGINNDTHVIVCDGSGTNGFYFGGRAWWMFYVSINYIWEFR